MSADPSQFDMNAYVMHHVQNSHEWSVPFLGTLSLPPYFSQHALMMTIAAAFLVIILCGVARYNERVPRGITNFLEVFVLFIRNQIAESCMGEEQGRKMTPFLCTLFFFVLMMNLLGLIPLFSTATGNINVTGALAFIVLMLMIIIGIKHNGVGGFLKSFVPSGVPVFVLILLVPIEVIMFFVKTMILAMRLFLNMLAGHLIIWSMLGVIVVIGAKAAPIFVLAVLMYLLEILIVFLQAYIFTFLAAIFIGQAHHPQH